ncbi:MAG: hypothetical protein DSY91_00870 [Deltaproteobacteria bacterium]|nr:MAG: hypothetical protein DSY91_00870 [Deltaproteobacteria bacterium]
MENLEVKSIRPEQEEETLTQTKTLLRLIEKTLKIVKVYPPNSPIIKNQKDLFNREFLSFLDKYGDLSITVTDSSLKVDDKIVYEEEIKTNNLAFLLYRDGVRRITFYKGLTREELQEFLEALAESWQGSEEMDVVNSLWERDFQHISYQAIDMLIVDLLEHIKISHPQSETSAETSPGVPSRRIILEEDEEEGEGEGEGEEKGPDKQGIGVSRETLKGDVDYFPGAGATLTLSEMDLENIREMIEEDRKKFNPPHAYSLALFNLLSLEEQPEKYTSLLLVLKKYFLELISNGNFGSACSILHAMNEFKVPSTPNHEKYDGLEKGIMGAARSPESIEKIRELLRKNRFDSLDNLLEYLSFLREKALPVLVDLLTRKELKGVYPRVRELLTELGQKDVGYLAEWISDDRPELTKQIVATWGEAGERGIPYLARCLRHKDPGVRLEVIRSLNHIGGKAVNPLLSKLLFDPEPDVRILAARYFTNPDSDTVSLVGQLIGKKKEIREKMALVDILKRAGSREAVAILQDQLNQKIWFKREENNRFKAYVVRALAGIDKDFSIEALKAGARSGNRKIRNMCKTALQKTQANKTT